MASQYPQARRAYLEWYSLLLSPPDSGEPGGQSAIEQIESRVDGLNFASEEFTQATKPYLEAEDQTLRMAALDSLLHQIEGDLEIATTLWSIVDSAEANTQEDDLNEHIMRSTRSVQLTTTYRRLITEIPAKLEDTAQLYRAATRSDGSGASAHRPDDLEGALDDLRYEIEDTIGIINDRAVSIGLRLLRDILTLGQAEWIAVAKAVDLLKGHEKAGNVGWGLEDDVAMVVSGIAGALRGVLINIVEKVLIVIEKNDLVRYTIADWLEDLRDSASQKDRRVHFSDLLEQLYQTRQFRNQDLKIWLKDAVDVQGIHRAADEIMHLGDNYDRMANQIRRLGTALGVASLFVNPVLLSMGLALQIGLLSTLVFAGYDHLDEGARALNITRGVKEVLINEIPVSRFTIQLAEKIRNNQIRTPRPTRR